MTRALWWWGPVMAWMATIFGVSSMSAPPPLPGGLSFGSGHALAYGLLALLVARALAGGRLERATGGRLLAAWVIAVCYGASDELHQRFVPGRDASLADWVVDGLGAAVAVAMVALLAAVVRRRGRGRAV